MLELSFPCGDIAVEPGEAPLLLVRAGVSVTASFAVLDDVQRSQPYRRMMVCHADRDPSSHALAELTAAMTSRLANVETHVWYEQDADTSALANTHSGWMDLTSLDVPTDAHVFMCGPLPFMRAVRTHLLERGVPIENIRYEVRTGPVGPEPRQRGRRRELTPRSWRFEALPGTVSAIVLQRRSSDRGGETNWINVRSTLRPARENVSVAPRIKCCGCGRSMVIKIAGTPGRPQSACGAAA